MFARTLVAVCAICATTGHRVRTWSRPSGGAEETQVGNPFSAFASFLFATNPEAGWQMGLLSNRHGHALQMNANEKASPIQSRTTLSKMSGDSKGAMGSGVFVTVEILPDRIDDFLKAMEDDVTKSRDKALDPGCLRFDLLRDRDDPNKFIFYEAYVDDDGAAQHKTTDHYKSWADFKASGGVASQTVIKAETSSLPAWAFQASEPSGGKPTGSAVIVAVDIKEDRVDDFLKAMEDDVTKSRDKELDPGCLRFDLLRDRENSNKFYFYEVYVDDEAAGFHKTTSHYKSWADFKASGGVENQSVVKIASDSIPGAWALQA